MHPSFSIELLIYSVDTCDTGGTNIARSDYIFFCEAEKNVQF